MDVEQIKRNLLLVEDEIIVSALLSEVLQNSGFEVRSANNAIEASNLAKGFDPDVAVIDINLGHGANGVELAYILSETYPGIALLLLTKHPDLRTAGFKDEELPLGCGFMRKDLVKDPKSLLQAIEKVISNALMMRQVDYPGKPLGSLTSTQVEILRLVSKGYTNAAISEQRKTSQRAVEQLLNSIYKSLGIDVKGSLNPRVEAVRQFISAAGTPDR